MRVTTSYSPVENSWVASALAFVPVEHHDAPWATSVTAESVLDLVRSRSSVIVLPPREAEAVLDEVRAVLAAEPGFAEGGQAPMSYVTRCSRATLPNGDSRGSRRFEAL